MKKKKKTKKQKQKLYLYKIELKTRHTRIVKILYQIDNIYLNIKLVIIVLKIIPLVHGIIYKSIYLSIALPVLYISSQNVTLVTMGMAHLNFS